MTKLPPGWAEASLEDLAARVPRSITDGPFGSNLKTEHYTDAGPRVVRLQNIGDGRFCDDQSHISEDRYLRLRAHDVQPDDVLIAALGEVLPRACLAPSWVGPAIVKADCFRFRLRSDVNPHFVVAMLNSPQVRSAASSQISGVGRPRLNLGKVRKLSIPLPPTEEQHRIVAAIEEQFSRLDEAERLLTRVRYLIGCVRSSLLTDAVIDDWPRKRLGDFAQVFVGTTPSRSNPAFWSGCVPWVSSGEVAFCRIKRTREMISPLATTPERVHPQGTVLLAMIGEGKTRGQAAILDVAAAHNQNSAAIRLDPAVARPEWLYYVLMQRYAETRRAGSGNNQPALNKARVQSIEIPLPTLVDQDRIVSSIELSLTVLARLATTVGLALTRSECLRRSILESAFEGCLVPQVSVTESAMMRLAETRSDVRTLADAQRKKRQ